MNSTLDGLLVKDICSSLVDCVCEFRSHEVQRALGLQCSFCQVGAGEKLNYTESPLTWFKLVEEIYLFIVQRCIDLQLSFKNTPTWQSDFAQTVPTVVAKCNLKTTDQSIHACIDELQICVTNCTCNAKYVGNAGNSATAIRKTSGLLDSRAPD